MCLYISIYAMCKVESIVKAVSLLCAPTHLRCAMYYELYAVCRGESIVQGLHPRLISPLSLTVSSPAVIYWMLSSKWTLSKNEIFQWWLLPFFFFWGRCDQSQPIFCAWLLLPQSWKRKTTDAKRNNLVNFGVNKSKNKWLAEGTKLCPCSRSQARLITINSSLMTL